METTTLLFKKTSILLLIFLSMTLYSCSDSPEATGKKIGDVSCDCDKKWMKQNQDNKMKTYQQLIDELKSGKIKTQKDYSDREKTLTAQAESSNNKDCAKDGDKMYNDAQVKFSKQDDRQTLQNAMDTRLQSCEEEKNKLLHDPNNGYEAQEKLEAEINALLQKLP